ncbi:exodeoxyribonuclease V subunit beta [Vibrio sp. TH_r3]|uniref:exodeoxyribonuclease V subunit beta n=1 Tax=Vibrio sp. TH_r3 TaxID=3082084 RepID=UPI00295512CF|nr:exodeoxyribonuclease V subunit beta [Vibrio sp. TH_r3]MDV7104735.1 exodeoxyribonuclease V subunit beta [Vibrio sp. TH_r3]
MPQTLNTMTFPLHGARLIEASAGTGKTFTISGLYLRLLLGHGDKETTHGMPLTVDQILVVTFTEAATAELRERIRSKIHDARIAFLRQESSDPVIKSLLIEVKDTDWAIDILLNAERQMDEAAIFTIHGFCQRMLTQNAFESGSRFSNEFVTDESKLKAQVVTDYWRRNFYSLSVSLANEVRTIWKSPDNLLGDISSLLTGAPIALTVAPMENSLNHLHQKNIESIEQFKANWIKNSADIPQVINESNVSKRSFSKKNLPAWFNEVLRWANSPTTDYRYPDKLEKFTDEFVQDKTAQDQVVPQHPLFSATSEFIANKPSLKEPLLAHAIHMCREQLKQVKQQKHWLSFDDLLTNLSAAIDSDELGILTSRIRQLYPVAMIDEFQDTDPLQYSIFSRIYLDNPETGLFMIGDPKQAIYAFRGADIFTYIRARNEVKNHYTLDTNWRSSADMIEAVNGLFSQASSPFMYDKDIPFYPVNPSPNAEYRRWWLAGEQQKALTYWFDNAEQPIPKNAYLNTMAAQTAQKISQILSSNQQKTYFVDAKQQHQPIEAGNIAVLVRTGSEGQLIRRELANNGVASVYLSNRDSVFQSSMATATLRLLQAVLYPEDERLLRAALASDILLKTSRELDNLNDDEIELENKINQFRGFRKIWQQRGVMPMLRAIMTAESIAENLLTQQFGERLITDFLHLGELLQQASLTLDSDHALIRWFAEAIQQGKSGIGAVDDEIQRLESERNLVQIVTIHKSKGLEYDLVFLPFISTYRESKSGQFYDDSQQKTVLDLKLEAESIRLSDEERLAEDLRLLYVAVTRAVYGCFIGVAPLRRGKAKIEPTSAHLNSVGYLLKDGQSLTCTQLESEIIRQESQCSQAVTVSYINEESTNDENMSKGEFLNSSDNNMPTAGYLDHSEPKEHDDLNARDMTIEIDKNWWITSYSSLAKQGHAATSAHTALDIEIQSMGLDIDSAQDTEQVVVEEPEPSIFTFPRGARPGTFLHTIFEQIDFTLSAGSPQTTQIIADLLQSHQYEDKWLPILQRLVDNVLSTPLDGQNLILNNKDSSSKLVEMEFLLPIEHLSSFLFNRLNSHYDPLSKQAASLGFGDVNGMLKGFIDLVFEHQGKYYVLDWKSNHLGDDPQQYTADALEQAMIEHRYDFQYQIYALALHRFLRNRVVNYQYETHFGGVYYLFLRGIDGTQNQNKSANGIFFNRPDKAFLNKFDQLIDGKSVEVSNAE